MISRHFGTPDTISPLRGINFSSCRTIKISTPVGVDIFMVRPTRFERATYRVGVFRHYLIKCCIFKGCTVFNENSQLL